MSSAFSYLFFFLVSVLVPSLRAQPSANDNKIVFAVIGDYGVGSQAEKDVAYLVGRWKPNFIITTGDNNYPNGESSTIDDNIGRYYHGYIFPYRGKYGSGAQSNRFFPSLGNHDWYTPNAQPYLDYFSLPGNERYYEFVQGPVQFFVVDSDPKEPDGRSISSIQGQWLKTQLKFSTATWKVVYMHHPPYSSSSRHGSELDLRWPFKQWGADVVLAGHDHDYERLVVDGFPYFVNGLGGNSIYGFLAHPLPTSEKQFNKDWGAMRVEADGHHMKFEFITRKNEVIDTFELVK